MFHTPIGLNVLNGGVILALMSVPIIVSIGEDALKAVPDSYREAALALGVTRWQLIYRVLLPAAKNGLLAAVLLGVGRAVGETMAVLMATGHAVKIPTSMLDSVRTLTATIAAELGEAAVHSDHYQVLFIIGILLFTITFVVNLAADLIVRGVRGEDNVPGHFIHAPQTARTSCWPGPSSLLMTLLIVLPLMLIVGYLVYQAWPILSLDFLFTNPRNGMRAGGIWSPLLGTIYLVVISLLVATPIGVLAAIFLNEYARDNWFTRVINLAVVNLAGVPSIVHALFGLGAFVLFAGDGQEHPGGLAHAGRHDPAGDHRQHQGSAGLGAHVVPRGLLERGRHALADHSSRRAAQLHRRHSHRRDPAGVARRRRDGAHHVHGRGLL